MFEPVPIPSTPSAYSETLSKFLSQKPSLNLKAIGDLDILGKPAIALFCSTQCPEALARQTYILVEHLRDASIPVVSGFHSPVEKACLQLLMQGTQPIIQCPARSLDTLRLSPNQKAAIKAKRLVLLSPFSASQKRATAALAERRNRLVAAIAVSVFIPYATPRGKTESLAQAIASQSKPLFTFQSSDTENLSQIGVQAIHPSPSYVELLAATESDSIKSDLMS